MDQNESSLKSELYRFMCRHNVLNLAYVASGKPSICAVWFAVSENLTIYYVSNVRTQHGSILKSGGSVAFTVQKDDQDWRLIQGVQGMGYCAPISPERRDAAWQTYSRRFPFVIQPFADLAQVVSVITLWSIVPDWLRLVDNTKGFGHKEELYLHNKETPT